MFVCRNYGKNYIFKPIVALVTLIITPGILFTVLVVFLLSFILFGIYRRLIILIAKFQIPNGRILTKLSSAMALKYEYTSPHFYITSPNILEGHLTRDRVQKDWKECVMNKLKPNGELQFPELRDCFTYFGGYTFRTQIPNFDQNNYINVFDDGKNGEEIVDKLKLLEIVKTLREKLFRKGDPLWELLIVNNYQPNNSENDPECSVVILKIHHVLADGVSQVNLMFKHLGGVPVELPKTDKSAMRVSFEIFLVILLAPFVGFVILYKLVFDFIYSPSKFLDLHEWHVFEKSKLPVKYELWYSEPIHKNIFRQIKSQYNVTTMSVVMNVITGGIKRMMLQKNLTVPKEMNVFFPIALANHPDTLTNHASLLYYRTPLAIPDIKKRIQTTDRRIKQAYLFFSQTTFMNMAWIFWEVFPHWVKRFVLYDTLTSVFISCMPLPSGEIKLFGLTRIAAYYEPIATQTNAGVIVCTLGDGDYFNMSLQIDRRLLTHPAEIQDLEKHILEELDFVGKNCLA